MKSEVFRVTYQTPHHEIAQHAHGVAFGQIINDPLLDRADNPKFKARKEIQNQVSDLFSNQLPSEEDRFQFQLRLNNAAILENQKDRSGKNMFAYLVRTGQITHHHIQQDGSINIGALSDSGYFQERPHMLNYLQDYRVTTRGNIWKKAEAARAEAAELERLRAERAEQIKVWDEDRRKLNESIHKCRENLRERSQNKEPGLKQLLPGFHFPRLGRAAAATAIVLAGVGATTLHPEKAHSQKPPTAGKTITSLDNDDHSTPEGIQINTGEQVIFNNKTTKKPVEFTNAKKVIMKTDQKKGVISGERLLGGAISLFVAAITFDYIKYKEK